MSPLPAPTCLTRGGELRLVEELLDRRRHHAGLVDLDVGQALAAVLGRVRGVLVDLLARQRGAAGDAQRGHAAVGVIGRSAEHRELAVLDQLGHVDQLQRDAQVRLVRTVAAHGLGPGHARELGIELDVDDLLEDRADHAFDEVLHVALAHEGELHVQLGELQLAVRAQGLVAEAARDLVVAVEAGHHQDLLEQLRALRQRVELARVHARRDHKSRAPSGVALVRIGVSMSQTTRVQVPAQRLHQLDAGALHALHFRTAQVEIAVLQARFLARVLVRVERQRRGLVEDGDAGGDHLDLAGADLVVDRMAGTDHALDLDHVLVAQRGGHREHFRVVGLDRHLDDALVVAQVDEAHAAEVAGHVGPAGEGEGLADQGLVDQPQKWVRMGTPQGAGRHRRRGTRYFEARARPRQTRRHQAIRHGHRRLCGGPGPEPPRPPPGDAPRTLPRRRNPARRRSPLSCRRKAWPAWPPAYFRPWPPGLQEPPGLPAPRPAWPHPRRHRPGCASCRRPS